MADRDKDPLESCLEQLQTVDLKLYEQKLHTQAFLKGSIKTGAVQCQKMSETEESQHMGQQVLDPTHLTQSKMNLELQKMKAQEEDTKHEIKQMILEMHVRAPVDLMLRKYNKDPSPPLL